MTQVSKHKLLPEMSDLIYKEFSSFVAKMPSPDSIDHFFNDFLTPTEKIMLSKRFMIMVLLMRGHTALHIKNTLFVSNSAVMSVSSWLKNASESTKSGLEKLNKGKNWESFFDNINSILDKLPPGRYSDWHRLASEKAQRAITRNIHNKLK